MTRLDEYREKVEAIAPGTVSTDFALEILDAAVEEVEAAESEVTLPLAMERSGRSRSYFERRLPRWAAEGLAVKRGRDWFIKVSAVPPRRADHREGYDPALPPEEIAHQLVTT